MKIIKNIVLICVCLTVGISCAINVISQLSILSEAKQKNLSLETETEVLEKENMDLKQRIAYATTSAFLEQQARELLGVGNSSDYWLELPKNLENIDLYPKIDEETKKSNAKQWINLFTP